MLVCPVQPNLQLHWSTSSMAHLAALGQPFVKTVCCTCKDVHYTHCRSSTHGSWFSPWTDNGLCGASWWSYASGRFWQGFLQPGHGDRVEVLWKEAAFLISVAMKGSRGCVKLINTVGKAVRMKVDVGNNCRDDGPVLGASFIPMWWCKAVYRGMQSAGSVRSSLRFQLMRPPDLVD
jgi:hypothetical protein